MFLSYFKIALRNFFKNKIQTAINLIGLAFGMTSVFFIGIYIKGELSYDRFHEGAENIYRITWEDENPQTRTPHPMAQALVHDFPEVESAVTLMPLWGAGLTRESHSFRNLEKVERYDESEILAVDTTFFKVFSFPLLKGDPKTVLHHTNGLLISESMGKKYFGEEDPMGKHLAVDSDTFLVEVVGVFKDVPQHSHFHFDFLVSYMGEKSDPEDRFYSWADFGHYNYIKLAPGADSKKLEGSLMEWARNYLHPTEEQLESLTKAGYGFRLQPITDIHLHSKLHWELEPNGNIDYVFILAAAAIFILVIACFNFINLTTSKSVERAKEIGIRKSMGAFRRQLALQFITESVMVSLASIALAFIIIELSLPFFNSLAGISLEMQRPQYAMALILLGIFIGLIAGFYPALYLSAAKPSLILKGTLPEHGQGIGLRNGLIILQFAISMALMAGSLIIFQQLDFLRNHSLGFNKAGVVVIPVKNEAVGRKFESLKNDLLKIAGIQSVSASSNIPGKQFNQHPIADVQHPQDDLASSECMVDVDYFNTMGIELKEGRLFSGDRIVDSTEAFVLNETAARQLNLEPVVGSEIQWNRDGNIIRGTVIGVVKDFNFQSLHQPMRPLLFSLSNEFNFILIKTDLQNFDKQISAIEKAYKQVDPIFAFEYAFLDDQLDQQYAIEKNLGSAVGIFSVIAVVIASFGLFGMALLSFYQRIKEVGIRKILGASSAHILYLLLKNFTLLVLAATLVATPITWLMMNRWLENFSYHITISPLVFILSGLALIIICWTTLSYLTIKTTRLNPVDTLRSE